MKALVLEEYNKFAYKDVPVPEIGPHDVLIAVKACGICGSDVHGMDGSTGRRIPPIIMGHEAAGVLEKVGDKVTRFAPGDRVTFDSTIYCGTCRFCMSGRINLCDNRRVLGVSCGEYRQHGAFADFVAVPERILYRLPDDLSFEKAAAVEAVSIAYHAVRRAPVGPSDIAVVIGAGMIGLLVIQVLRVFGCTNIIVADIDNERLKLAQSLGAREILNSKDIDLPRAIFDRTGGRGADVAFDAVGLSPTVKSAVACLSKGGALVLIGNLAPTVDLPLQTAVVRELTLYGSCASSGEYPQCLNLIAKGEVNVDPLISAVAPLAEGAKWFKRLYDREPGLLKVILKPE